MRFLYAVFALAVILISLVATSFLVNRMKLQEWLAAPKPPGRISSGPEALYHVESGQRPTRIVLFSGLGTSILEYTSLGEKLSTEAGLLMIDRPGYSWSKALPSSTPEEWIKSLSGLIQRSAPEGRLIFVGFSIGAEIAARVALQMRERVQGVVAVTPLPDPKAWINAGVPEEFGKIFVDQSETLARARRIAHLGFFRFVNMTPYKVPREIYLDVLNNLANPTTADAALFEYQNFASTSSDPLPFPVRVVRHNSKDGINTLKQYELTEEGAKVVEGIWTQAAVNFAGRSADGTVIEAYRGLYTLHLDHQSEIVEAVKGLLQKGSSPRD